MDISQAGESFRGLLLRHRGRSGLTQRELAARLGADRRTVQDWEAGVKYPTADRLQGLIAVLLEAGGLTVGHEAAEAEELWAAVLRDASRMHTPFDQAWFASLVADRTAPPLPSADDVPRATPAALPEVRAAERSQDWGEAPDVPDFVGRVDELALLRHWVLDERCRLLVVLGMGGIGKTSLVARLAQELAPGFECVYWRSIRDAPLPGDWLAGAIGFLSDYQLIAPAAEAERLMALARLLRERRCLLVLDNCETLFESGQKEGRYREGLAGYGRLLQEVGGARHQSCLVLTSREAPPELAELGGGGVRTFQLGGLGVDEAQALLAPKHLVGTSEQWAELTAHFGGNGLALKVVGERIRELFGGDLGSFLEDSRASNIFGAIRRLLAEHIERSSAPEQRLMRVLAVEREAMRLPALLTALGPRLGRGTVLEALEALRRRSLVERAETPGAAAFTLQSVVLEYVTDRLVEAAADEIARGLPVVLSEQPLIQAQAKDYVRDVQERLIGTPILRRLEDQYGAAGTQQRLEDLLEVWRDQPAEQQGYGPGNLVNLLRLLCGDLRGLDLSRLAIRQAYLAQVDARAASLAHAELAESVLAEAFSVPLSVALSGDGALVAVGTTTGAVWVWQVAERTLVARLEGHTGPVPAVALAADGRLLASGGTDRAVRLWDTHTGHLLATFEGDAGAVWGLALAADGGLLASGGGARTVRLWDALSGAPLATLQGHNGVVRGVALAADRRLAASGGEDGAVVLWDTHTGQRLATLQGHIGGVLGVALGDDGRLLASGGADGMVRLWETGSGRPLATMRGHTGTVRSVAVSAESHLVASGGFDGTVRLWDTITGLPVATLEAHTSAVRGVALADSGRLLASAGTDGTVRLWDASMGRPLVTLHGDTSTIRGVALSSDGDLAASGAFDGTVQLWDAVTGRPRATLEGHAGGVYGVALGADGRWLASGGADAMVRLWDTGTGRLVASVHGHTSAVWGVALTADGRLLASCAEDRTVRLWEARTGQSLATLEGHTSGVLAVTLSADGRLLASSSADGTARLWDASTGQPLAVLSGHLGVVWSVALAAEGRVVATSGEDGTVRLWDAATGQPRSILEGHAGGVYGVAFSADGRLLASSSADGTVRLWDAVAGVPRLTLPGNASVVYAVALAADGGLVASGGADGTVRLWDARTGTSRQVLRSDRHYERMDITGLAGITAAQRQALLALGAVEQHRVGELTASMPLERMPQDPSVAQRRMITLSQR